MMLAKKQNMKRILSSFLAMVMLLGLLPTAAFATGWTKQVMDGYFTVDDKGNTTEEDLVDGKIPDVTQDGYTVSKNIDQNGENAFDITLKVVTSETVKTNDAAVVLVLDTSASMSSEMKNLRTAAKNFVDSLVTNNEGGKIYVSVVGFGGYAYKVCDWVDITTHGTQSVKTKIDKLSAGSSYNETGGTNLEAGLMLARNRLEMVDVAGASAKYTVLFTDGEPTYRVRNDAGTTSTDYAGTGGTGGSTDDSSGINCSEKERNEAIAVASQVKALGSLYTICYGAGENILYGSDRCAHCGQTQKNHTRTYEGWWPFGDYHYYCKNGSGNEYEANVVTMSQYLENEIATPAANGVTYAFDAEDSNQLNAAFKNIASSVSEGSSGAGTKVVDPMGRFINFGEVESVRGGTYNVENNTLTWTLDPTTAEQSSLSGTTTYTFTLKYSITLDTAAQGFAEETNYPTNGYTRLEVPGENDVVFNVPGVFGTIPEYTYKVEYYKEKTDGTGYELVKTTDGSKTDLWTSVDIQDVDAGYETKYASDNYHYVKGDPSSITISAVEANNVIKLYYDRDEATVTVNHFYKIDHYAADGTFTKGEYPNEPQTTSTESAYVGESFTAEKALSFGGKLYEFDEGGDTITVEKDATKNVINLYYTRTEDERADASVVVNHVYRTHTWILENGKYVLKDSEQPVNAVEKSTGLKATTIYTAKTNAVKGYEDFIYDTNSTNSITLQPGENTITLYFDKTVDDREEVSLTVRHHYTKTVVTIGDDGQPAITVDPDNHVETVTVTAYKGETVTLSEQNTYGGESYTSDPGNAGKLTVTNVQGGEEIDLYYTINQAPGTTSVTVKHIYRTITHETVETTDDEGNVTGTEVVDSITTDDTVPVTANDLYVGQSYTAGKVGREGYSFNASESDNLTATVQANGATVIELYYDRDENKDDREAADIDVKHVYTTHLTTIVDGEVKTIDVQDGFAYDLPYEGKAGDTFTATTNTTFNENEYTVVGNPNLDVVLQPGTNTTIVIHYERSASNLVDTSYTVNYVYNTYTMVVEDGVAKYGEPSVEKEPGQAQNGYVNQIVTLNDGARDGFTADPANPATSQTLRDGENVYTFVYNKYVPLDEVSVTVKHHYTTTTIAVDGTRSDQTDDVVVGPVKKYVGTDYVAEAVANGFTYDRYTVTEGITATQNETSKNVTVTASGDVVVDFYYSKTVDNSKPVNYSIQHVYVTINWDGTRTVSRSEPITGSSYATKQLSAATDNNGGNYKLVSAYFNDQTMPGFDPADPQDTYAVTLVDGENVIVYTYERSVDNRQATQVKVIHNYYARDTYTTDSTLSDADYIAQEGVAPEYRSEVVYDSFKDGIWVGQEYTAVMYNVRYLPDEDGVSSIERVYDLVNATPEGGKIASIAALDEGNIPAGNVVTFNLIRKYSTDPGDTSYKVIHQYYTDGSLTGSTERTASGKVGATINAADIAKETSYGGNTYSYTSASVDSITLAADGSSVITLRYDRSTSPTYPPYEPDDDDDDDIDIPEETTPLDPGPGTSTEPTPTPTPSPEPSEPEIDIPEETTPLDPGPGTSPEPSEPDTDIPEETTPLGDLPQTGAVAAPVNPATTAGLVALAFSMAGCGLYFTFGRKKGEEED